MMGRMRNSIKFLQVAKVMSKLLDIWSVCLERQFFQICHIFNISIFKT